MKNIEYKISTSKVSDVLIHLLSCNKDFSIPLDERVDLNVFSVKIVKYAITFEAWDEQELIGLLGVYFNDLENKMGFINHFSVLGDYRGNGISKILFNKCIDYGNEKKFRSIILEVAKDNKIAISLYIKFGFISKTSKNGKIIMKKELKEEA